MIFVTIGTQEPFDRLIKAVDEIASLTDEKIIAQALGGKYKPKFLEIRDFLEPKEFEKLFSQARLIISHAGMGSIISALTSHTPIVVMPRKASLKEHRNEHQLATAEKFRELNYIHVVDNVKELQQLLKRFLTEENPQPLHRLGDYASDNLLRSLSEFFQE